MDFNLSKPGDDDPCASAPHPILGDIRVRQAISHAIDYDTLINDVLNGQVQSSTNPFAYGWYKCDIPRMYNFDVEKAKQLSHRRPAGWKVEMASAWRTGGDVCGRWHAPVPGTCRDIPALSLWNARSSSLWKI